MQGEGGACPTQTLPLGVSAEMWQHRAPPLHLLTPPSTSDRRITLYIGHSVTLLCDLGQVTSPFCISVCEIRGWILEDPRVLFCPGRLCFHESLSVWVRTNVGKIEPTGRHISFPTFCPRWILIGGNSSCRPHEAVDKVCDLGAPRGLLEDLGGSGSHSFLFLSSYSFSHSCI